MKRKITIILCALALIFTLAIAANAYEVTIDECIYEISSDISVGSTVTVTEDSYYGIKAKEAGYYIVEGTDRGNFAIIDDIDSYWPDNYSCIFYLNKNQKIYLNVWPYDETDTVELKLEKLGTLKSYAVQKGKNEVVIGVNSDDWDENEVYISDVPVDFSFSGGKTITVEDWFCTYKGNLAPGKKTMTSSFCGKKVSFDVTVRNASYYIKSFSLPEDYTPTAYELYDGNYYWDYPEYITVNMTDGSKVQAPIDEYGFGEYDVTLKNGKTATVYAWYSYWEEDCDEMNYYEMENFTLFCGDVENEFDIAIEDATFFRNVQQFFENKLAYTEDIISSVKKYLANNFINILSFLGFDYDSLYSFWFGF